MNAQVKVSQPIRVLDDVEVTKFSPVILTALETDINKTLADLSSKYGITLTFAYGKTSEHTIAARVTGYVGATQTDGVKPQWTANFAKYASQIGLTQEHFGKQVRNLLLKHPERETYRIVGMTPKSLDLIIENSSKKYYRISIENVSFVDDEPVAVAEPVTEVVEPVAEEVVVEAPIEVKQVKSSITELLDVYDDSDDDVSGLVDVTFDSDINE